MKNFEKNGKNNEIESKGEREEKISKLSEEIHEDEMLIEYLNKARQSSTEYEEVYRKYTGERPELADKFAVGKNGEPYTGTAEAAHDLIEFLADEAEEKAKQKEKEVKRIKKAIKTEVVVKPLKDLLEYLNKVRQSSTEYEEAYRKFMAERSDLKDKFAVGKNGEPYTGTAEAAHDLIEFLADEAEEKIRKTEGGDEEETEKQNKEKPEGEKGEKKKKKEEKTEEKTEEKKEDGKDDKESDDKKTDSESKKLNKENLDELPLGDLRDLYLKAKRLRGNIIRGKGGKLLKRKLEFRGEEIDFGGDDGAEELQDIREAYQEKLASERSDVIKETEAVLKGKLEKGETTEEQYNFELRKKIIDLVSLEQKNIDDISLEGIEKNIFEKMKTKWRQFGKTRLVAGVLLGTASLTGIGGAGVIAARAGLGGVGTYMATESGLEKFSKTVGHKGLVNDILKKSKEFITPDALEKHIYNLSSEEIKDEANRLRMLQVEKGVSLLGEKNIYGDGRDEIAKLILKRDTEIVANEVMDEAKKEDPENAKALFSEKMAKRLAEQTNIANEGIESEVDKERTKKIARKSIATFVGSIFGSFLGSKGGADTSGTEAGDLIVEKVSHAHTVAEGENTWDIIEANLDSKNVLAGASEGVRTHIIDSLKDIVIKMGPEQLRDLGFSSGDANLINPGEILNMTFLDNPELMSKVLLEAKNVSPEDLRQIVANNVKIAEWLATHRDELKGVYDSSVIDQVLAGKI